MESRNLALNYAHANSREFTNKLKQLISIPSISGDPEYKMEIEQAAEWLASHLRSLSMNNVSVMQTLGAPIVFAEKIEHPGEPILLFYGHYDVCPIGDSEDWKTKPFLPSISDENLCGRGASDMKGQVMAGLNAIESILMTSELPFNIKILLEGEEEIGSHSLKNLTLQNKDLFRSDFCLNLDSDMLGVEYPTITYGMRGWIGFELKIFGPSHELHSGLYGGAVHNPANVLAKLIGGMHDADGHVTWKGFYDDVQPLSMEEREEFTRVPMDDRHFLDHTGVPSLWGEQGYS